jgi:hypothetical protein
MWILIPYEKLGAAGGAASKFYQEYETHQNDATPINKFKLFVTFCHFILRPTLCQSFKT